MLQPPKLEDISFPTDPDLVALAGDWHGNGFHVRQLLPLLPPSVEVVVQLGDFMSHGTTDFLMSVNKAARKVGVVIMAERGNHDRQDAWRAKPDDDGVIRLLPRVWLLPDGFRWAWHGRTWLAAGGAVSVDKAWRAASEWWADEELTDEAVDAMLADGPADVMISHDAPWIEGSYLYGAYRQGLDPWARGSAWPVSALIDSDAHQRRLRRLVDGVRPSHIFHGHHHTAYRETVELDHGPLTITGLAHDKPYRREENVLVIDARTMAEVPLPGHRGE